MYNYYFNSYYLYYDANVGDIICLLSMNDGNSYVEVTKDHKQNSLMKL